MPEPSFLGDGDTPRRSDTKRLRWLKILATYQNVAGSNGANNPMRGDPTRVVKQKLLNAIVGTTYTG